MVRRDTPRMVAISSKEKPQKNFRSTSSASSGSTSANSSSVTKDSDVVRGCFGFGDHGVERCDVKLAAAFDGPALAHVVDDQAAHCTRRVGEKAPPVEKWCGAR